MHTRFWGCQATFIASLLSSLLYSRYTRVSLRYLRYLQNHWFVFTVHKLQSQPKPGTCPLQHFTSWIHLLFAHTFLFSEMAADIPVEEAKVQLLAIQKSTLQNQKCIDCGAPSPTWASPMYGSNSPIPFRPCFQFACLSVCVLAGFRQFGVAGFLCCLVVWWISGLVVCGCWFKSSFACNVRVCIDRLVCI